MFSLTTRKAAVALAAGLSLTLAACSDDAAEAPSTDTAASQEPVAEIPTLDGEQTAVTLDPSFIEGLGTLMLTPGVVGDATFDASAGQIAFPITGGNVTYFDPTSGVTPYVQGEILHDGSGLSLTGGGTTVELTDFVVDPANSVLTGTVTANGEVAAESAELFFLDGSTLNPLQVNEADGTAVLEGTTVSLTQDAADLLNTTFGTDALTEFFLVGVAEITVELPA
jgi:hypothetical protein